MRVTRALGAALLGLVAALAVAAPAQAGAIYPGAGYKLTGVHSMTVGFTMPSIDCSKVPEHKGKLRIGIFTTDLRENALATATCTKTGVRYALEFAGSNEDGGETGAGTAAPGHHIVAVMFVYAQRPYLEVTDTTAGLKSHPIVIDRPANGAIAAGAVSAPRNPAFTDTTLRVTVNGGLPFTKVPHVRHVETIGGRRVIGTGFPWHDGTHFTLYAKGT